MFATAHPLSLPIVVYSEVCGDVVYQSHSRVFGNHLKIIFSIKSML